MDLPEKRGRIEEYVQRRRETIMKNAEMRKIYGKCKSSRKIASS
jgi:hypothetical protein